MSNYIFKRAIRPTIQFIRGTYYGSLITIPGVKSYTVFKWTLGTEWKCIACQLMNKPVNKLIQLIQ